MNIGSGIVVLAVFALLYGASLTPLPTIKPLEMRIVSERDVRPAAMRDEEPKLDKLVYCLTKYNHYHQEQDSDWPALRSHIAGTYNYTSCYVPKDEIRMANLPIRLPD